MKLGRLKSSQQCSKIYLEFCLKIYVSETLILIIGLLDKHRELI